MLLLLSFISGIGAGLYLGIVVDVGGDSATKPDIQSAGQGSSEPAPS